MKLRLTNGKIVEKDEYADVANRFEPSEIQNPCKWAFNRETGDIEHQFHDDCDFGPDGPEKDGARLSGPAWVDLPVVKSIDEWWWFLEYVPESIAGAVEARGMVERSISLLERAGGCRYDWQDYRHRSAIQEAKKFFESIGVEVVRRSED